MDDINCSMKSVKVLCVQLNEKYMDSEDNLQLGCGIMKVEHLGNENLLLGCEIIRSC